jgi:hypothetical protein
MTAKLENQMKVIKELENKLIHPPEKLKYEQKNEE